MSDIVLGFEIGSGSVVKIPLRHTAVTGQTQESGKTTTLEGIITRSGLRAVAFITKRGEKSFRLKNTIAPYFRQPVISAETPMWKWVGSILEAAIDETMGKEERAAIIQASDVIMESKTSVNPKTLEERTKTKRTGKKVASLEDVYWNIQKMVEASGSGGFKRACICLEAYFQIVIPQIKRLGSSKDLQLKPGINVMDLESLTDEMQSLVIRSVIETVYREKKHTVVIVPEAAKFIPNRRSSPVRFAAEMFIRQGLGIGNVLMIDSQDLANVATEVLKSVGVWILGKQNEINEVKRVVAYIPSNPKIPTEAVMQLGKGEFFAVYSGEVKKVYVQPAGMDDVHAQAIARGEIEADSWKQIVRKLDAETVEAEDKFLSNGRCSYCGYLISEHSGIARICPVQPQTALESGSPGGEVGAVPAEAGQEAAELAGSRDAAADPVSLSDRQKHPREECPHKPGSCSLCIWPPENPTITIPYETFETMTKEIGDLRAEVENLRKIPGAYIPPSERPLPQMPMSVGELQKFEAQLKNGNLDALIKAIQDRAPKVLALATQKPTIEIALERPRVDWPADSIKGRLAQLVAQKFFAQPKKQADVLREFKRRGWLDAKTGNAVVIRPMAEITELGFLTIETEGYQEVAGMVVNLKEAK